MSRSYRRFPFSCFVGGASQADWKRSYNRSLRRGVRRLLADQGEEDGLVLPILDEVADPWDSPRRRVADGRAPSRGDRPLRPLQDRAHEVIDQLAAIRPTRRRYAPTHRILMPSSLPALAMTSSAVVMTKPSRAATAKCTASSVRRRSLVCHICAAAWS